MSELSYERWEQNRGIKGDDLSDGFRWPLDNLTLALKRFFGTGVFRGGKVRATGSPSANVVVEAMGGVSDTGLLIMDADVNLAVPANGSGLGRIDLVAVAVAVADDNPVNRPFWNPTTQVAFGQNTVVRRFLRATPVLIVGTPGASPVVPALPANHIALATIAVANGFTTITDANITRQTAPDPLQVVSYAGNGVSHALPYTPGSPTLQLSLRAGSLAVLFAQVYVASNNSLDLSSLHKPLVVEIEEVGGGVVASGGGTQMAEGSLASLFAIGMVVGPKSPATTYRVKFRQYANGGGSYWGGISMPAEYESGTPTRNILGAIIL